MLRMIAGLEDINSGTISIDGEVSFDPDGDSITCSWISTTDACGDECSSDECSFDLTLEPGDYTLQLTVIDNYNAAHSIPVNVSILASENEPPVITQKKKTTTPKHHRHPKTQ